MIDWDWGDLDGARPLRVTNCPDCLVPNPQSFESRLPAGHAMGQRQPFAVREA